MAIYFDEDGTFVDEGHPESRDPHTVPMPWSGAHRSLTSFWEKAHAETPRKKPVDKGV